MSNQCTDRLCCEPNSSLVSYRLRESAARWQPVILSMGSPKSPMLSCARIGKGPEHGEREDLRNQPGRSAPHDGPPHRHAQRLLLLRSGACRPESVVGAHSHRRRQCGNATNGRAATSRVRCSAGLCPRTCFDDVWFRALYKCDYFPAFSLRNLKSVKSG